MKSMSDLLIEMANRNIGSLCIFLKNPSNNKYLDILNNKIPKEVVDFQISEKIYYYVNGLSELQLCDCGKCKKFIGFKNGYRPTCGDKDCYVKKRKQTCIDKFGVDNPKKSTQVIEKEKLNIKNKWGDHFMKSKVVQDKFKNTMISNWGVEWSQQSDVIKEKSKITWQNNQEKQSIIELRRQSLINKSQEEKDVINQKKFDTISNNFGTYQNFIQHRLEAIKSVSLENYGVEHHFMSPEVIEKRVQSYKSNIIEKIKRELPQNLKLLNKRGNQNSTDSVLEFSCSKCDKIFLINRQLFVFRKNSNTEICLVCNPNLSGKSRRELEILKFISENYQDEIISNTHSIINGELDIYLPQLKLAFEFNGLYWHSELYKDKYYHQNKTKDCLKNEIQLIHIWEDDWDFKKPIVQSIILNKLGKSNKISARKCQIKEITDNKIVTNFLETNHLQGFVPSKIKIGLFFNDELVSLMTFGSLRKSVGHRHKEGNWELLRFCNKLNTTVVGGSSKMFKYFLNKIKPQSVISFSDNSRGSGEMYNKLGFNLQSETQVNYYWVIDGIKKHRFGFRKSNLVKLGFSSEKTEIQIMHERNIYRVFDCGSKKWIFEN
jgi:hypothetical protein